MPYRLPLLLAVALNVTVATAWAEDARKGQPRAVLELFTSQGCASCPPADALLGDIIRDPSVIGLTMPTKVWDYLGWADTLASDGLTKRQMSYAVALRDDVYTPQMVVNGDVAVVGSDRGAVQAAIDATASQIQLPISLAASNGVLSVDVGVADVDVQEAILWLAVIEEQVSVPIRRGENRGRELVYHNVVTDLRPIGMWKGSALSIDLPMTDLDRGVGAGCVVFAQADTFVGPGKIIGAAMLSSLGSPHSLVVAPAARP